MNSNLFSSVVGGFRQFSMITRAQISLEPTPNMVKVTRFRQPVRVQATAKNTSQIGKTKVFLRVGQMAELDARRAELLGNAARIIRRQMCAYIARKEYFNTQSCY